MDIPIQIGFMILQYAKLRMLAFYYDCLSKFTDRTDFELIQMDTDSLYFALSSPSFEEAVKSEMKETYKQQIYGKCTESSNTQDDTWFPRACCKLHATHDKRTPGIFKIEFNGNEMVALCSKTYIINNDAQYKFSCKGINKRNLTDVAEIYKSVLKTQTPRSSKNTGFRVRDNSVFTYTMMRCGFTYFYCKRQVDDDGIHTKPLDITLCPSK